MRFPEGFHRQLRRLGQHDARAMGRNFFYLAILQVTNLLLPLLMVPYLTRVLGIEKVGLIFLTQSLLLSFNVLTEYGYNLTATREVALQRQNPAFLSDLCSRIFTTKMLLSVLAGGVYAAIVLAVPRFRTEALLFLSSFPLVLGQAFSPIWFYQGVENVRPLALLTSAARVLFLAVIFWRVRAVEDYVWVNMLLGSFNLLAALGSCWLAFRLYHLHFRWPAWAAIRADLRRNWSIFVSNFSINIYSSANLVILGFFASDQIVGLYAIAEKIMLAARQVIVVIFQTTYPRVCALVNESATKAVAFLRRYFLILTGIFFPAGLLLWWLADWLTWLVTGAYAPETAWLLRAFSFLPLVTALSSPSFQLLLALNQQRTYTRVLIGASVLNLVLNLTLVGPLSYFGTATAVITTELFITLGFYAILYFRENINILRPDTRTIDRIETLNS